VCPELSTFAKRRQEAPRAEQNRSVARCVSAAETKLIPEPSSRSQKEERVNSGQSPHTGLNPELRDSAEKIVKKSSEKETQGE